MIEIYPYKAGEQVLISIPGIDPFVSKIVCYDQSDDQLAWCIPLTSKIIDEVKEFEEEENKSISKRVMTVEVQDKSCLISQRDQGDLVDEVGYLPFRWQSYAFINVSYISKYDEEEIAKEGRLKQIKEEIWNS